MFFKRTHVYVKIRKNAVWVKQLETQTVVDMTAPEPFTTTRLLVGELTIARKVTNSAIKQSYLNRKLLFSPKILIQPLEYIEEGLSEVEELALLGLFAVWIQPASRSLFNQGKVLISEVENVVIWLGEELTDVQVKEKFIELARHRRSGFVK